MTNVDNQKHNRKIHIEHFSKFFEFTKSKFLNDIEQVSKKIESK